MEPDLNIRAAAEGDSQRLAVLAGQLGYQCLEAELKSRIAIIASKPKETILVIERQGSVIGWASLQVVEYFYTDSYAEITGLVIDQSFRGQGLGTVLLNAAEIWAQDRGYEKIRLRTNAIRLDAHRFYENAGYKKVKEQFTYIKTIGLRAIL